MNAAKDKISPFAPHYLIKNLREKVLFSILAHGLDRGSRKSIFTANHRQMKRLYLAALTLLTAFSTLAQSSNLTVFTEMGENITVYINGEKQNETPSNNIKMEGISEQFFQIRIDFEDDGLPDFSKNGGMEPGTATTMVVKPHKKGKYVLRMQNSQPLDGSATSSATKPATRPATEPSAKVSSTSTVTTAPAATEVKVTETTTTTTTPESTGESVEINMSVDGIGIGVDMKVDGVETTATSTTTTTTTTTTTSEGSGWTEEVDMDMEVEDGGCMTAMGSGDFDSAVRSIKSKSFEDSKLTMAKQITKGNCLSAEQVRDVMRAFDFEETKLDYAKFAYDYTVDQGNYYKVNDAFDFEMTIEELDAYLQGK